ncbi:polysaccharide lyase 8 family protein [Agriterribacter sp.]|uniref:polysaccharide lyase 8 family protein n=1 Tax=Agriterribacter sp. TaxID=2821509 RepID=UPI002C7C3875|nr:polysaccharide lyase 8 family protein [Agriterribacter sp.]HTN09021.1 polysaccharide lyase 8 family protein [Agriterribacter sp.]
MKFTSLLLLLKYKTGWLLTGGVLLFISASGQSYPFDTIMNRINADLHIVSSVGGLDRLVNNSKHTLTYNDSAWRDIDYMNETGTHLSRIKTFAIAYTTPGSIYFHDHALRSAIIKSLYYWYKLNFVAKNWWYNRISYPQFTGQILIIMRYAPEPLPAPLESDLINKMMNGDPFMYSGANKTDIALHYLYRACLTQNKGLLDTAVDQSFAPLRLKNQPEGLQYDYSNLEHGNQLQISSYGSVFLSDVLRIAAYLLGTPYALQNNKLDILSGYYRNTYLRTIRGSCIDFNTEGRGISRPNMLKKKDEILRLQKALLLDPTYSDIWNAAIARTGELQPSAYKITPTHTHFWRGDYDIHQRPAYSFNIRTVSTRTIRTERGNNENILGKFLPDGSTNIQRRGSEYYNIMPIWEWDKLPGVTNRDYDSDEGAVIRKEWGIKGTTNFAGGVSDSVYGVTAYMLNYDSVAAKKAWFFFDDEVVCLGAGINSTTPENITTTVNQCWLNGKVTIAETSEHTLTAQDNSLLQYKNPRWILHDSIGYFFPAGGNVQVSNAKQTGNWYKINYRNSKNEIAGNVFKLWFTHGAQPTSATYAYIVVPGIGGQNKMQAYPLADIQIIRNSDSIQAVAHSKLDMLQVVFYKAAALTTSALSVSVNKPCIVYLKNSSNPKKASLYIADPTQQYSSITVNIKLPGAKKEKELICYLPQLNYAGATTSVMIEPG